MGERFPRKQSTEFNCNQLRVQEINCSGVQPQTVVRRENGRHRAAQNQLNNPWLELDPVESTQCVRTPSKRRVLQAVAGA